VATVDQCELQFVVPGNYDTYIDLNIHFNVKGNLIKPDGTDFDSNGYTTFVNNSLPLLFCQCSFTLNGVSITPSKDLYPYPSYLETLLNMEAMRYVTSSKRVLVSR